MLKKLFKIPYWYLIAAPFLSLVLGVASNQAVLIANHDKFPVLVNEEKLHSHFCAPADASNDLAADIVKALTGKDLPKVAAKSMTPDPYTCSNGGEFLDDTHIIMTKKTHLNALADVFDLKDAIYSIGDFLIMLGEWIFSWAPLAWLVLVLRKHIEA